MEGWLSGAGKGGVKIYCLTGCSFSLARQKALEKDGGNGCATVRMYLVPQSCVLKNG